MVMPLLPRPASLTTTSSSPRTPLCATSSPSSSILDTHFQTDFSSQHIRLASQHPSAHEWMFLSFSHNSFYPHHDDSSYSNAAKKTPSSPLGPEDAIVHAVLS
jgi:hypothetical protein